MKSKSILTSTVLVAVSMVIARVFGFLREVTLAGMYGAGMESDAFVIAFTIPTIVLALFGVSAATVFIPAYTRVENNRDRFTGNILTLLALIGVLFTAVFTIFPQSLVFLFASQLDTETFSLATELLRIMVWAAVPIILVGVMQSYLQIKNAFFLASVLIIPVNVYTILSILLSRSLDMTPIMGYGVVAGYLMALIFLFTAVYWKGYTYKPVIDTKMPELKMLLIMLAPVMLTTLVSDIHQIVERNFASSLPVGSISSLNYAAKTVSILVVTIGAPLATVLYPRMSELAAQDNIEEIRKCVTDCIKRIVPILLPVMIGITILARPVVRIIFERGDFTQQNAQMTVECMQMYAPLLVFSSLNAILTRALFSIRDTKSPAVITAISVAVGIVINFLLIGPLAHMGLALSSSVSAMLTTVLLFFALRKRVGLLHLKKDAREWGKIACAAAVMGLFVRSMYLFLPVMHGGLFQCIALTGVLVLTGVIVYVLMHATMHSAFFDEIATLIWKLPVFQRKNTRGE